MRSLHGLAPLALLFPLAAGAIEGAVSADLTVGARQVSLNTLGELGVVPDRLWLVAGYGFLKSPDVPATDTSPKVATAVSHLLSAGLDVSPHRSWIFSLLGQFSPRAGEQVPINLNGVLADRVVLGTVRQGAGASALIVWDSAGAGDVEGSVEVGGSFNWNLVGRTVVLGANVRSKAEHLFSGRPQLGASLLLFGKTTLSVRAGYTFYSANPLTVGRLTDDELAAISQAVVQAAQRLSLDLDLLMANAQAVLSRLASFDAVSGYPYAPVRFDLRVSVQHRFSRWVRAQLSWTYLRYVPGQGFGNVAALKLTFRPHEMWRFWVGGSVQLDVARDFAWQRAPDEPLISPSGLASVGAEFSF